MKIFCLRLPEATAAMILIFALPSSSCALEFNYYPSFIAVPEAASNSAQSQSNEAQIPASGEATVQPSRTFSGRIIKENGEFVLQNPVTKVSHKLSDQSKVKKHLDKQVKVKGKLDKNSNVIQVESVEPQP